MKKSRGMTYILGTKSHLNIPVVAAVVVGVALSIIVSAFSYYAEKKVMQAEFNEDSENLYSALKREIDSNLSALASVQALYYISGKDVERSEFRNFTNHLLKQHTSIQSLSWIPRVQDSRREAYERASIKEGFPGFQFTEKMAQGKMKRAEKRKEYFPVYFIEPYKGHEITLGFNLGSNPAPLEALEVARKTGEIRATGRIILVQETKNQFGFIVFAPVYRKVALINSEQSRWDNLEGFTSCAFRISDIVEKAIGYIQPEGIDFFIYDESAPEKEQFLYTHSSLTRKTPLLNRNQPETNLMIKKVLDVGGRKWMVIYSATPDYIAAMSSWHPWEILLAGLAFTGLVAGFLFVSRRYSKQLRHLASYLQTIREKERTVIAREIHDDLGQSLTALKFDLINLTRDIDRLEGLERSAILDKMNIISSFIDELSEKVHKIAMALRPGILDHIGLTSAIEWQLLDFQKRTGISVEYTPAVKAAVNSEIATAVFRILQEALTNITKHANATRVEVILQEKAGQLILVIEDNGEGFSENNLKDEYSLGLLGMKERADSLGGTLDITTIIGAGTKVVVSVPNREVQM